MFTSQLLQQLPKDASQELWFLFEQQEFYTFKHLRNLIAAIRFVKDDDFALDENNQIINQFSNIPIEYDFEIHENGDEKIKPYILEGINIYNVNIFKNETFVSIDFMGQDYQISTTATLYLLESWLTVLKNATKEALKKQYNELQIRITQLSETPNISHAEKFELQVLSLLQKCDTTTEFDLLQQKTEIVAANSALTKQLLQLIAAKRAFYQL